jgi:cytochrome c oxidase accessory protein FixG
VAVCPTGIDIRNGPQLECIQCALCIDACDEIMTKVNRPTGLIAYDTVRNLEAGEVGADPINLFRPRVILYAAAMVVVSLIMLVALVMRPELEVSVLHDRNPLYVRLSDGGVRNGYTIKLLNKLYLPRAFSIGVEGLPGATLDLIGHEGGAVVPVPPDNLQSVRIYLTLDKSGVKALIASATPFSFVVTDIANGARTEHAATFQGPSQGPSKGASR